MRRSKRRTTESTIFVKVARIGGLVHEVALNGERTVADALEAAGVDVDGTIRVNGKLADEDTNVENGAVITVAGKVAGN